MKYSLTIKLFNNSFGYIALTSVLIIMSVVVLTIMTVTFLSIGEGQIGLSLFKGEGTLDFVEGCADDALLKARSNLSFGDPPGSIVTVSIPEGVCETVVISKSGSLWTMEVTNAASAYKRKVRVIFNRNATGLSLVSWKED